MKFGMMLYHKHGDGAKFKLHIRLIWPVSVPVGHHITNLQAGIPVLRLL